MSASFRGHRPLGVDHAPELQRVLALDMPARPQSFIEMLDPQRLRHVPLHRLGRFDRKCEAPPVKIGGTGKPKSG